MKTVLYSLIFLLLLSCVSSRPELSAYEKFAHNKKLLIAVLPVENRSEESRFTDQINNKSGVLLSNLARSGRYRVIEREKLAALMEEQELGETGIIDANSATDLGKILGVDAVVLSAITRVQYRKSLLFGIIAWVRKKRVEVDIESRIVSIETGEVLATTSLTETAFDRKGYFLGFMQAGGKHDQSHLEAMAIEHAMIRCADQLALNAVQK